jgi:hypothetical protein
VFLRRIATWAESHSSDFRIWIVETSIKVSGTFVTRKHTAFRPYPLSLNKCSLELAAALSYVGYLIISDPSTGINSVPSARPVYNFTL